MSERLYYFLLDLKYINSHVNTNFTSDNWWGRRQRESSAVANPCADQEWFVEHYKLYQ